MNKDRNTSLYLGLFMILVGIVFMLDLNGLLPVSFIGEYINIIVAVAIFILYLKSRKFYILICATFFVFNGTLLIVDGFVPGYNHWSGIFLIPGLMLLVAFIGRQSVGYLIPGALLTCWGIYLFLITAGVLASFTVIVGMFFVFTGIAFLIVFFYEHTSWAAIPAVILGGFGVFVATMGLGPIARNTVFQVISILIIAVGVSLIFKSLFGRKKEKTFYNAEDSYKKEDE